MSSNLNRRLNPRYACNGPAEVRFVVEKPAVAAKILNISAEGVLIALAEPALIVPSTPVELTFTIHHLLFRVRAHARVVRPGNVEIGFQFFNLSERMLLQIQDLVQELAETQGEEIPRLGPLH